jgi:YesN/AraC family two-component response regulator
MNPLNKILYVDDEEINLDLFRWTFKNHFNVFTALSAKEGLLILDAYEIPVVVTDFKMPEMNGMQFIEAIKKKSPEKICIILTGFLESIVKGKEHLVFNILSKPWEKKELQLVIQSGIDAFQKIA